MTDLEILEGVLAEPGVTPFVACLVATNVIQDSCDRIMDVATATNEGKSYILRQLDIIETAVKKLRARM